jgi:hypothetical protein
MRVGERLEFRNLRCTGKYHTEAKLRDGTEITRWHYQFAGPDGNTYEYRGRYFPIEPGCYWDVKATVGFMRGNYVSIKVPKPLTPIDGPALL